MKALFRSPTFAVVVALGLAAPGCRAFCKFVCPTCREGEPVCVECDSFSAKAPIAFSGGVVVEEGVIDGAPVIELDPTIACDLEPAPVENFVPVPTEPPLLLAPTPPPRRPRTSPRESDQTPKGSEARKEPGVPRAGLDIDVEGNPAIAAPGSTIRYKITVQNRGAEAIARVELSATLSENLVVLDVEPKGVADFEKTTVTFKPITPFTAGLPLTFTITARVLETAKQEARISVQATSPILTAGPYKQESVTPIEP